MNLETLKLHETLMRHAQGMLKAWQQWLEAQVHEARPEQFIDAAQRRQRAYDKAQPQTDRARND